MNGDDRNATHEARIGRLEVGVEFIIKRLDDFDRRMEQGFRDLRMEMRWHTGILFAAQMAALGLLLRSQHVL
ncbi:hypothetical protein ACHMW6_18680 [Pseudoduganella sp. UC29_106]|uniref:hypothetical protein n=1 Tax=Pseudoduganella sp. UC29_106 TaxID=3374553 RepID=UPI0037575DE9